MRSRLALGLEKLYANPISSRRTGPLYNAFSYPTKIDPEAIAVFIAAHTRPNQTVLDVFGGSGTTGVAARLCDRPTERMKDIANQLDIDVEWGPRSAAVYELSPIGTLAGQVISNPPDPAQFQAAADQLVQQAQRDVGHVYDALSPNGQKGTVRYVIWSEVLCTPCCERQVSLYEATVSINPAAVAKKFACPSCNSPVDVSTCPRVVDNETDELTGEPVSKRRRIPARICGRTGSKSWSREPCGADFSILDNIPNVPNDWVPTQAIEWGDLYRSGYHSGISRYHHFYTPRNLAVLARLWKLANAESDKSLRDALKLLVLSYNASHSTLLTRVVAKKSMKDLVVTGAQSGVLYVSGLPVEKNLLQGVRRKIATFAGAFDLTWGSTSKVRFECGSSASLPLESNSVDYVFTDPPFGDYIPYSEVNQINEAWLGNQTDRTEEAIISSSQRKSANEYGSLLGRVFGEVSRVLKPGGCATVVFHASRPSIWEALGDALRRNHLGVLATSILDKEQVSFKQVVSSGGTRDDAIFLVAPNSVTEQKSSKGSPANLEDAIVELELAADGKESELSRQRMWSRYVSRCISEGQDVTISAPDFYERLDAIRQTKTRNNL